MMIEKRFSVSYDSRFCPKRKVHAAEEKSSRSVNGIYIQLYYEQNTWFPMVQITGRVRIHWLLAVRGL